MIRRFRKKICFFPLWVTFFSKLTNQFLYTQDDELEITKRSPRRNNRDLEEDIEYLQDEPPAHFKIEDELFPEPE